MVRSDNATEPHACLPIEDPESGLQRREILQRRFKLQLPRLIRSHALLSHQAVSQRAEGVARPGDGTRRRILSNLYGGCTVALKPSSSLAPPPVQVDQLHDDHLRQPGRRKVLLHREAVGAADAARPPPVGLCTEEGALLFVTFICLTTGIVYINENGEE